MPVISVIAISCGSLREAKAREADEYLKGGWDGSEANREYLACCYYRDTASNRQDQEFRMNYLLSVNWTSKLESQHAGDHHRRASLVSVTNSKMYFHC